MRVRRSQAAKVVRPWISWKRAVPVVVLALVSVSLTAPSAYASDVNCVSISMGQVSTFIDPPELSFMARNECSRSTSGWNQFTFTVDIPGYWGTFLQRETSLSISERISFLLFNIKPGTYFPQLTIEDSNFGRRTANLGMFTIKASPSTSPTSKGFTWTAPKTKQLCTSAPGFDTKCLSYPNFSFEMCSSIKNGQFEEYSGGSWSKLWKVYGKYDLSRCKSQWPYLVRVEGTSKQTGTSQNRISFPKTNKVAGFTQNITFKVVWK